MSYSEVRRLIDEGKLDQAITLARKDIEEDKNEESCLGLFDVIKECCINEINANNNDRAEKCLNQMEVVAQGVRDVAKAQRTIEILRNRMIDGSEEVLDALRMARSGSAYEAFERIIVKHHSGELDPRLHEQYGQIIYYYLREGLRTMGPEAAQEALTEYLSLKNQRPSSLHSSIANMASHVCAEYEDIKLLPFIESWGVNNITEEDMRPVEFSDRSMAPLYQRLIDRCFQLGNSLDEIMEVFLKNEKITKEEIVERLCRKNYSMLYEASKKGRRDIMNIALLYTCQTEGKEIKNQYHSKALATIVQSVNNENISLFPAVMEKWGMKNFRPEDWQKIKRNGRDIPSLGQKALQVYIDSMKVTHGTPNEEFESWLREAIVNDPKNEQNQRQLARLLVNRGEHDEACQIYRRMLNQANKSYLWYGLAMSTLDMELKRSALCKAMTVETREEMLGDIRLELAQMLINEGKQEEAQRELLSYYNVCTQRQIRLKQAYDYLVKQIEPGTQATPNNRDMYESNTAIAENFVIGETTEEKMKVIEILRRKNKTGFDYIIATMLSLDGTKAQTTGDKLGLESVYDNTSDLLGKTFVVRYSNYDNHVKVVEVTPTDEDIDLTPLIRIGYVDGLDKSRGWFHVYDKDSAHFVSEHPAVNVKIGDFIEFYPIIPKDDTFKTAAIVRSLDYSDGVAKFGTERAVVARVDYSKHQFNCVSESGLTGLVGYDNGTAPLPGEMLRVAHITKKNKAKDNTYTKYISVEPTDEECEELRKTVVGPVHLLKNEKNFEYGFVNFEDKGYYVSGYQMKGKDINEGDIVKASVVNNGDNWFSFEVEKVVE